MSRAIAAEAARLAGVPENTMYRWLRNPEFRAAFRRAQSEAFDDSLAVIQKNSTRAAWNMIDQLDTASGPLLLNVATRIIDLGFKARSISSERGSTRTAVVVSVRVRMVNRT